MITEDILLEMPTAPVSDRQAEGEGEGEGGMIDEAGSMGLDHLLDAVAPGSSMLIEMLKMAMESEGGMGTPHKLQLHTQQATAITGGYEENEESWQEEK